MVNARVSFSCSTRIEGVRMCFNGQMRMFGSRVDVERLTEPCWPSLFTATKSTVIGRVGIIPAVDSLPEVRVRVFCSAVRSWKGSSRNIWSKALKGAGHVCENLTVPMSKSCSLVVLSSQSGQISQTPRANGRSVVSGQTFGQHNTSS